MRVFLSNSERRRYYRNLRIKIYLYLGLLLFLGILGSYLALNLPFLQIRHFEIIDGAKVEELKAKVLNNQLARFLGFKNFISWPSKIGNVEVEKDYFNGILKLNLILPEKFAIWCTKECYWINREGSALEPAPDTEGSSISKISDKREFTPIIGKSILQENLFSNIVKIIDGINNLPVRIKDFDFNERLQELMANGARGEKLIFSARFAPSLKAFAYLNDLILSGKLKTAEYVDLTVENRIYIKPR